MTKKLNRKIDLALLFCAFFIILAAYFLLVSPLISPIPVEEYEVLVRQIKSLSPQGRKELKPLLVEVLKDNKITYAEEDKILDKLKEIREKEIQQELKTIAEDRVSF